MPPRTTPIEDAPNIGPKSAADLRAAGIRTVEQVKKMGWEKALQKLVAKFPERANLNMAAALVGVATNRDWRKVAALDKARAKDLVKSLKPKKTKTAATPLDPTFRDFVVHDQLVDQDVDCRKMFGGFGLYHEGKMFGVIFRDRLYFKTDEESRAEYLEAGMSFFKPSATQSLKSYFEVPGNVLEDRLALTEWARAAWLVSK